ncbi:MAG TPA: hypothetical protein EYP40_03125, partial [Chromatiales bacterium]|nr:hypothetical protein [Chromatiales bacterium]
MIVNIRILIMIIFMFAFVPYVFGETEMREEKILSEIYFENALRLFNFQLGIEGGLYSSILRACVYCEIEEEVCLLNYDDVISLLKASVSNDSTNYRAEFYLGKVYWLKSYIGEGQYDRNNLNNAKKYFSAAKRKMA